MRILVNVSKFYDWEPMDEEPTQAELVALKAKLASDGKWLKKVEKVVDTYTEISMPESEIKNLEDHFKRIGSPKSRAKVVAWYLEEKVMPHHAPTDAITSVEVLDEPEVEAFLNTYFG